jgi:hypothetical protein
MYYMSIKILISASGLNIQAWLLDEALPKLIQLTQEFRDEKPPSVNEVAPETSTPPPISSTTSQEEVQTKLRAYGSGELLNMTPWDSYPEKILLLGAWYEATGGSAPWRYADMENVFSQAKEKPPANFPRDVKLAIREGWIHATTPRTYTVTRTGWNKISEVINKT